VKPIAQLAEDLASGRSTAAELTEQALERIQAHRDRGGVAFLRVDAEHARLAARASDLARKAGIVPSPLAGIPVSVKDLFDVAGQVTTAGSEVLRDSPAAAKDALAITRLKNAGAVIVGRTNMTEFAFSALGLNPHYGTPTSPWRTGGPRIAGGSSSGAAVSVAEAMVAMGLGTDTGGSVRIPAALCGLTGFKPTQSRVPREGAYPLSFTLDSIGPLARTVTCCALVDAILAGEPCREPDPLDVRGLRLAVPQDYVLADVDTQVGAAFSRALSRLSAAGAVIVEIATPEWNDLPALNCHGGFSPIEAWTLHRERLAAREASYDRRVAARIKRGAAATAEDYLALVVARRAAIEHFETMARDFDALAFPTVPVIAPLLGPLERDDDTYARTNLLMLRNTSLINFVDGCSLSVPCHAPDEPPASVMLSAPAMRDRHVLRVGCTVEAALSRITSPA
jgi:Asp-tRNA(Asn)/Glu-tRNA(Gln) amidotransferase A subunit family amidase